jgi:transcriptional regulator with XRE-family HTH domain
MSNENNTLIVMGERIKALRLAQGLKVEQLATASGLSVAQVYRLQNDERPNTSAVALARIAQALNTTLEYLIGLTSDARSIQDLAVSTLDQEKNEKA